MAQPSDITGVLLLDKPAGWTSHDVVGRSRRWLGTRKIGHAGTLDPMATGLLVLGVGRGTRLLTWITGLDKVYTATVRLGSGTPSDDRESEPDVHAAPEVLAAITPEMIDAGLDRLRGEISQVPSTVSAIKVDGKRAHARVRDGEEVELAARSVTVSELERSGFTRLADGQIEFELHVRCSSGTYVRALARDLGRDLDVGGHLRELRRSRVGAFEVSDALDVPPRGEEAPAPKLMTLAEAARRALPVRELDAEEAEHLRHGRRIAPDLLPGPRAAVLGGELIAVIEDREDHARPLVVFAG